MFKLERNIFMNKGVIDIEALLTAFENRTELISLIAYINTSIEKYKLIRLNNDVFSCGEDMQV
jgi:hypothetical protein